MGGADEPPEVVVSWNGVFIPPAHWKAQSTAHYTFRRLLGRSTAREGVLFLDQGMSFVGIVAVLDSPTKEKRYGSDS